MAHFPAAPVRRHTGQYVQTIIAADHDRFSRNRLTCYSLSFYCKHDCFDVPAALFYRRSERRKRKCTRHKNYIFHRLYGRYRTYSRHLIKVTLMAGSMRQSTSILNERRAGREGQREVQRWAKTGSRRDGSKKMTRGAMSAVNVPINLHLNPCAHSDAFLYLYIRYIKSFHLVESNTKIHTQTNGTCFCAAAAAAAK